MIKFSQQPFWIGTKIQISLISCIVKWIYETELQAIHLYQFLDNSNPRLRKTLLIFTGNCQMPFWHLFLKRKSLDLSAGVRLLKSNSMAKKSIPNWKLRVSQISKKLFKSAMTPTKAAFQPLFKKSTVQPVIFCNTSKTALQPLCKMSTVQQIYTIYFVTTKGSPPTSVQNIWSQVLQKKVNSTAWNICQKPQKPVNLLI